MNVAQNFRRAKSSARNPLIPLNETQCFFFPRLRGGCDVWRVRPVADFNMHRPFPPLGNFARYQSRFIGPGALSIHFFTTLQHRYPRYKYVLRYDAPLYSQFIGSNNGRKIRPNESPLFHRDSGNGISQFASRFLNLIRSRILRQPMKKIAEHPLCAFVWEVQVQSR